MKEKEEIKLLQQFRKKITEYLFQGCSPPEIFTYTQGIHVDKIKKSLQQQKEMKEALQKPEFQQLTQDIRKMKVAVHKILSRCSVSCVLTQYPQKNMGGPILRFDLMDLVTENKTRSTIRLKTFTDKIDEAISCLEEIINPTVKLENNTQTGSHSDNKFQVSAFIAMALNLSDKKQEKNRDVLVKVLEKFKITATIDNSWAETQKVSQKALDSIKQARLIIADLTNNKPQVYYNAGYANALDKTVIYIAKKGSPLKFDLTDNKIIYYSSSLDLKSQLTIRISALEKQLLPTQ